MQGQALTVLGREIIFDPVALIASMSVRETKEPITVAYDLKSDTFSIRNDLTGRAKVYQGHLYQSIADSLEGHAIQRLIQSAKAYFLKENYYYISTCFNNSRTNYYLLHPTNYRLNLTKKPSNLLVEIYDSLDEVRKVAEKLAKSKYVYQHSKDGTADEIELYYRPMIKHLITNKETSIGIRRVYKQSAMSQKEWDKTLRRLGIIEQEGK